MNNYIVLVEMDGFLSKIEINAQNIVEMYRLVRKKYPYCLIKDFELIRQIHPNIINVGIRKVG